MHHSLQTSEYNPSSKDRYLSPWIFDFRIRRSMGFFDFSIHTSRGQVRIGQVPRAAIIPATPTQRTERPIKLPKKDAAAKVYGPFFIFILWVFFWFLYFSALLYVPWLIFWICSACWRNRQENPCTDGPREISRRKIAFKAPSSGENSIYVLFHIFLNVPKCS